MGSWRGWGGGRQGLGHFLGAYSMLSVCVGDGGGQGGEIAVKLKPERLEGPTSKWNNGTLGA